MRQEETVTSTGSDLGQATGGEGRQVDGREDGRAYGSEDGPAYGSEDGRAYGSDLSQVLVTEREHWQGGPPHALFARLRHECPVHWTSRFSEYPEEAGYWSVTRADDIHTVNRDWRTYSSELGGVTAM